jgi:hypothetical protein
MGRFPLLAEITRSSLSHPCTNDRVSPLTLPSPRWSEGKKSLACGVAKPCSQRRKQGAHCLSAASLRAAGVGEPRRAPEGPRHCQHGFGSFCSTTKVAPFGTRQASELGLRGETRRYRTLHGFHGWVTAVDTFPIPVDFPHLPKGRNPK